MTKISRGTLLGGTSIALLLASISTAVIVTYTNTETYQYFDFEGAHRANEFASPYETSVDREYTDLTFHELTNTLKRKEILVIRDWERVIAADHFLLRGYRRFERPWLQRLFSRFNYWYIVFEIEYLPKRIYVRHEWFVGDGQGPVASEDFDANPTESVSLAGKGIHSHVEEEINKHGHP